MSADEIVDGIEPGAAAMNYARLAKEALEAAEDSPAPIDRQQRQVEAQVYGSMSIAAAIMAVANTIVDLQPSGESWYLGAPPQGAS